MTRPRQLTRGTALLLLTLVIVSLVGAAPMTAATRPAASPAGARWDTPVPPTPRPDATARPTDQPGTTPAPEPTPGPGGVVPPVPGTSRLTIGYRDRGIRGRLPLIVAQARGYFTQAGFELVELVLVEEPLPGVLGGQLDIGVVDTVDAANGVAQGLPLQAIAGYHNYRNGGAAYGGDVLTAASDLVATDPGTITAFLSAYARALQDIADPDAQDAILALAEAAGIPVTDQGRAEYADRVADFAPFDGGFGSVDIGGGLGELEAFLAQELGTAPDLSTFIAWPALLVAQTDQLLPPNPVSNLIDPPGLTSLRVGVPAGDAAALLPLTAAQDAGAFAQMGFEAVEIVEVEEPLTALLAGEVDLAVVGTPDAASGVAQGLPVALVAGYRNYAADGVTYGGDALVASTDLVAADPGTITAFLIAHLRGLRTLAGDGADGAGVEGAAAYAPFDGGFGPIEDGGLGALSAYLATEPGAPVDTAALIAWPTLVVAQTARNLPANPTAAVIGPVPIGTAGGEFTEPTEPGVSPPPRALAPRGPAPRPPTP